MERVVYPVWNLHYTTPITYIGVPFPMPNKVLGSGRGLMYTTKSILYREIDILAPVSNMMGIISI